MDIYRVGENEIGKADIVLNRGENKHLGVPKIAVGRFRLNQPGRRERRSIVSPTYRDHHVRKSAWMTKEYGI